MSVNRLYIKALSATYKRHKSPRVQCHVMSDNEPPGNALNVTQHTSCTMTRCHIICIIDESMRSLKCVEDEGTISYREPAFLLVSTKNADSRTVR